MLIGIQAGFNGDSLIGVLSELTPRFNLVRVDVMDQPNDVVRARTQEVLDAGCQVLAIVNTLDQIEHVAPGSTVEYWNEPDLIPERTEEYNQEVPEAVAIAEALGIPIYIGSISNLNTRGLNFLHQLPWNEISSHARVSVHRYPTGSKPTNPHSGFPSRLHEIALLKKIIGNRRFGVSEVGYHTARQWKFIFPYRWSDIDVAVYMSYEKHLWESQGADFCVAYQLNDGPTNSTLDRYGFRDTSGNWKLVSKVFHKGV